MFAPSFLLFAFSLLHFCVRILNVYGRFFDYFQATYRGSIFRRRARDEFCVFVRCKQQQIRSPRIRTFIGHVVRRCKVRNLPRVVVSARERKGVTSATTRLHPQRILLSPFRNASGIGSMPIVFFRANDSDRRVQVRGGSIQVRVSFLPRRAMDASTGLSLPFGHIYLPLFVGDRCSHDYARLFSTDNVLRRGLFSFFREGQVRGAFALRTRRAFFSRLPFEEISRRKGAKGVEFKYSRIRRDHRLLRNVRRSIVRVSVSRLHTIFRLLTNGYRDLFVVFFLSRTRRLA